MGNSRISIIVPVYNTAPFLERCMESILSQDFQDYEVLLVDDGSSDESADICDRYAVECCHVRTFHKPNGGVSSARNLGIEAAKGEYVMFVDSDDSLAQGALTSMMSIIGEGTVDFAVGSLDILTDGECTYRLSVHADSCYASGSLMDFWNGTLGDRGELFMGPCAKLYRRSLLVEHNIRFDESLSYAEDKLFVYTFLRHIASAAACSSVIYLYDHRQGTLSGGKMTDHRASQLLEAIPNIAAAFMGLAGRFERAECFLRVYHNDIVCGNVIRVLRYFMKSRTALLTGEALCSLYSVMDRDVRLKFGERQVPGQLIAVALYKGCGVAAALYIYRHISFVLSRFYA